MTHADKRKKNFPDKLPSAEYKMEVDWFYAAPLVLGHVVGIYALWTIEKPLLSCIYVYVMSLIGLLGNNVGAHRLFTHKTFKANAPLRILLVAMQTLSMQRSLHTWVCHHRLHHKYMDTNADPHNSRRGVFFSHIGWLMVKPHPDVAKFDAVVDKSDLIADPFVMFQYRHYYELVAFTVAVTTLIPYYGWGETLKSSFFFAFLWQYGVGMHITWLVNSLAHCVGWKPYDVNLSATDFKLLSFFATGEGFHNYHHAFPWDYKTSELGNYSVNFSKAFIDFFAWIGWATELKTVSEEMIRKRVLRTGGLESNKKIETDGNDEKCEVWGWDDPNMLEEDKKLALVLNKTIFKY